MTEETLQATFVLMFRIFYPELILNLSLNGVPLLGSPKQKKQIIDVAKKQGLELGIPDLQIILPDSKVLNLEFKKPGRLNGQSKEQIDMEFKYRDLGHNYYVVDDITDTFKVLNKHLPLNYSKYRLDKLLKKIPQHNNISKEEFLMFPSGISIDTIEKSIQQYF